MSTTPPPTGSPTKGKSTVIERCTAGWRRLPAGQRARLVRVLIVLGVLTLVFIKPLAELMAYASRTDLHSHIVLIPVVVVYLLHLRWTSLPAGYGTSAGWALAPLLLGGGALAIAWNPELTGGPLSRNDHLAAYALAYTGFVWAGVLAVLGRRWVVAALFPVAFLIFIVPLPDRWVQALEGASQAASAEVTDWLFSVAGIPRLRDGTVFQLPGIVIEVAQECSGIRSSWVLFITSLVAAEMFLRSPWRRLILVALVIPLGILRNGFRILVISWLCVEIGPHMIDSIIHHRGGPIFFALSLVPFFGILWILRRGTGSGEAGSGKREAGREDSVDHGNCSANNRKN